MEWKVKDVVPDNPATLCCCGCCSIVFLVLIILFFPCTVTQLGQFKYGLVKNKFTGEVALDQTFEPGRYWIGFWKEFIEFPSVLNTIEFSTESPEQDVQHLGPMKLAAGRDVDDASVTQGKLFCMEVSIQYRLQPDKLGQLYEEYKLNYEDRYVAGLEERFRSVMNGFPVKSIWTEYRTVSDALFDSCKDVLAASHATCWGLQLWRVWPDVTGQSCDSNGGYTKLLIAEQVNKQRQETAEARNNHTTTRADTQVILANYTKDITVIQGQATAIRIDIEREAIAKAEGALVEAQAQVLKIIKDTVSLARITDGSYVQSGNASSYLTDKQLVIYKKYVMLQDQAQSHVVANLGDGLGSLNSQDS